ncbi:MAG: trehalose-6-phosphate synthase [Actinomycetota bacterium]|jgi:trehalose 6-phosphate synthase|nr:trehalose-6-phosphate synthase [Actinomycetota bacterium]
MASGVGQLDPSPAGADRNLSEPTFGDVLGPPGATVVVSNRGPLSFSFDDAGEPVQRPSAGGLAGTIRPLLAGSGATWVSCALSDADRAAASTGRMSAHGFRLEMVDPDPDLYRQAYDVVSNATLWFCHHHLFDGARSPRTDAGWGRAWDAYRSFNALVAARVADVAPHGARILVQDYHLCLVGSVLRSARPDLRSVHFSHTPFAEPDMLAMLPDRVVAELLEGMAAFRACGFHARRWADAYEACQARLGDGPAAPTFVSALSTDPRRLEAEAGSGPVRRAEALLDRELGGAPRKLIVRVDRMELSKNVLRGFWAFDELLSRFPDWRGRVTFLALTYPSRQGLPEYVSYQAEVEAEVARINDRWGDPGWTPIVLHVEDDFPRSLAALARYDVLLVNPVRDGMNLVAKEGPLVNRVDGVVALSRETGAFAELAPAVVPVPPYDVSGTCDALVAALEMAPAERARRAESARAIIRARHPVDWLADQLRAAD